MPHGAISWPQIIQAHPSPCCRGTNLGTPMISACHPTATTRHILMAQCDEESSIHGDPHLYPSSTRLQASFYTSLSHKSTQVDMTQFYYLPPWQVSLAQGLVIILLGLMTMYQLSPWPQHTKPHSLGHTSKPLMPPQSPCFTPNYSFSSPTSLSYLSKRS